MERIMQADATGCTCPLARHAGPFTHEPDCPTNSTDPTEGLPPDLAVVLRDQSVIVPQDAKVWELLASWRNAKTDTPSAIPAGCCPECTKDLDANGYCFECRTHIPTT